MSAVILKFEKPMSNDDDDRRLDRDLHQLQVQISEINRHLGSITAILERSVEDRRDIARALGEFRDDINELMALGPKVAQIEERSIKNETKIEVIERWRNRTIGARAAIHGLFGAVGGGVVLAGEMIYRLLISGAHR